MWCRQFLPPTAGLFFFFAGPLVATQATTQTTTALPKLLQRVLVYHLGTYCHHSDKLGKMANQTDHERKMNMGRKEREREHIRKTGRAEEQKGASEIGKCIMDRRETN